MTKLTDDYAQKCKELEKSETERKALIAANEKHVGAKSLTNNDSCPDSSEVESLVKKLKKELEKVKCTSNKMCDFYLCNSWETWKRKYHEVINEQGRYEDGLRDGLLNNKVYQEKVDDIKSVAGFALIN